MQSKENNSIDTRTLPQIWESLSPERQKELRPDLMKVLSVNERTVYNYTRGIRKVKSANDRRALSDFLNKELNLNTRAQFLFQY